jgi:hypothetical protein
VSCQSLPYITDDGENEFSNIDNAGVLRWMRSASFVVNHHAKRCDLKADNRAAIRTNVH